MSRRTLPRTPPEPLKGERFVTHFELSRQLDLIVARHDSLVLPLGPTGLFFPEGVIACIEVKSTLDEDDLEQAGKSFEMLSPNVLKVSFAYQLKNSGQRRKVVAGWAKKKMLTQAALPDLVIISDNSAIIRGNALRCLGDAGLRDCLENTLYKYGDWEEHKWLPLALLVFELAHRGADEPQFSQYLWPHLPKAALLSSLSKTISTED